jgi:hypothetical protein
MPDQNENVKEIIQPEDGKVVENTQTEVQKEQQEPRPGSEAHNWKEVREKLQKQEEVIAELNRKLESKQKPKSEEDPFSGYSEDDLLTVAESKKIVSHVARQVASEVVEERTRKQAIEQVPTQFSDYDDVIKLVDEYVKENPSAYSAIESSPNPRLTAYQLVKSSQLYHKKMTNAENVQKVLDNSSKPGSSQSVGSTSPLSDIGRYERMTPDRAAHIRKQASEYASKR